MIESLALFCFILIINQSVCNEFCYFTVDITDGKTDVNGSITINNDTYSIKNYYKKNGQIFGCVCRIKSCIRKCCPDGQVISNKNCTNSDRKFNDYFDLSSVENLSYYYKVNGFLKCSTNRVLALKSLRKTLFIERDGKLIYGKESYNVENYCMDYFQDFSVFNVLFCLKDLAEVSSTTTTGMIISMPFLIATFLVYALLPDKNLPAKSLMCYVLSLLFAYIMLVTIQLNSNLEHGACVTIAYLCYFFFMVSFFWMNSSCIDIWLTFSGIKGITGQRTQERKRFIYYCLYSWGLPLIMTSIVVVMTMEHLKDSIFFTAIGDGQCWFKNGLSTGIYFYFPIAILLITNIVLFAITALKIRNVQRDTKVLNAKDSSKHEKDKQRIDEYNSEPCYLIEPVKNRGMQVYDFLDVDNSCLGFNLYIKLLFAMGVNWSMEVISWLVQWQSNNVPTYIWYITDFCNAMYGVLIFFIFVFKKNIWIMLKKRYLQIMGRSTRAHSMGTSTHRTTLFTAISLQSIPGAGLLTKMHSTPNDNRNELRPPKIH
nr:G-protein coupled receptor Mth2-like isoform X14 [Onthophagus taurus]